MPLRIGLIVYPLFPIVLALSQRSPASKFAKAGAISPETARRPSSLKAEGDLTSALRSGLIVSAGDGRYYVNIERYNRRVRLLKIVTIASVALMVITSLALWPPWTW